MSGIVRFLSYNNAVPIAITLLVVGAGATFAATDPQAIYGTDQRVVSVDNTYIADKDLSSYNPRIQITGVTEDAHNYYVSYDFSTIDVKDYVWQDVTKHDTLTVSKDGLGKYGDLGLYATDQFNQLIAHNLDYLKEAQSTAQKNTSQKVVATSYSGLVGKFLDATTETLPGYQPVVVAPVGSSETASAAGSDLGATAGPQLQAQTSTDSSGSLQVMGNNPSHVPLKSVYVDLGVYVANPHYQPFNIKTFVNGTEVSSVQIDTSKVADWTIRYEVTDDQGSTVAVERIVQVFDPNPPPPALDSGTTSAATSTAITATTTP